jgi:hypothetical protein
MKYLPEFYPWVPEDAITHNVLQAVIFPECIKTHEGLKENLTEFIICILTTIYYSQAEM